MSFRIAGVESNSFVDYPGKIAMVVFTPGCNMNCYYCHNRDLITNHADVLYTPEAILKQIGEKGYFLDGIVISGGEPTLQPGLEDFIRHIKERTRLSIKLDTNGSKPEVIRELTEKNLLDYIAMDIKAPKETYEDICLCRIDINALENSIRIIMTSGVDYEFRTTFAPALSQQDILMIAKWIDGAQRYTLQQYRQPSIYKNFWDPRLSAKPYSNEYITESAEKASVYVKKISPR